MQIESHSEFRARGVVDADGALLAKGKDKGKKAHTSDSGETSSDSKKKKKKNQIECHYCKKKGHKQAECRKKKWDEAEKAKENTDSTAVTTTKITEGISLVATIGAALTSSQSGAWIVDSGATTHMTPMKE